MARCYFIWLVTRMTWSAIPLTKQKGLWLVYVTNLHFLFRGLTNWHFFHFCIKDITWIVIEGGVDLQQFVAEKHTNIGRSFNWSYYDALRKIIYVNKKWFLWPSTAKDCIKSMIIKHPINDNNETIDTGFPRNALSLWTKNTTVHQI